MNTKINTESAAYKRTKELAIILWRNATCSQAIPKFEAIQNARSLNYGKFEHLTFRIKGNMVITFKIFRHSEDHWSIEGGYYTFENQLFLINSNNGWFSGELPISVNNKIWLKINQTGFRVTETMIPYLLQGIQDQAPRLQMKITFCESGKHQDNYVNIQNITFVDERMVCDVQIGLAASLFEIINKSAELMVNNGITSTPVSIKNQFVTRKLGK